MTCIHSDARPRAPSIISKLYLLGFLAGTSIDTVAYPAFWWELHTQDPDAAEALNMDVRNTLYERVSV